jgi:hypothetical protein
MQELLEEGGPLRQFGSLKALDLAKAFVDDHSMVDTKDKDASEV